VTIGATEGTSAVYGTLPTPQVTGTTGTGSSGNGLAASAPTSTSDKDMFLQLLVAQMKYQDPMNPTDSAQFLAQSAQFTSLEKMQSVADQTGLMLGAQMAFGASGLVGRTVTYTLQDGTEGSGVVHGVQFGANGPVLDVDGLEVPISQVQTVTDGQPTDPTTTP
jgi:flagellar basal-body rod modification protein FlgD